MNFDISFWQQTGLDPLLLGQPKLWITSSDPTYLVNLTGGTPSDGDSLNVYNRFNDSSFNPTSPVSNKAIYSIIGSQPHPYGYIGWYGSTTANGYYRVGTTTDFSFLHQSGSSSTIYWIHKNNPIENTSITKVLAATAVSSANIGFIMTINNVNATVRRLVLAIYKGVAGQNVISFSPVNYYSKNIDYPIELNSIRIDLNNSVGQDAAWWYINGKIDSVGVLNNTPSVSATHSTQLNIGNRNSGGLRYNGYIGDFIVFNGIHDEATHLKICNYLKQKWRIS